MNAQLSQRRPRKRFPWLAVVAVVVALVAIGVGGFWWKQRGAASTESAWRTAPVARGNMRVAISATGTLSAISTVTVGSQVSGEVVEVLVDYNDKVHKGQLIARIDPSTYETQIRQGNAQIASARAGLANAQAALRNAELDCQRKSELGQKQLVARSDVDLACAAQDQARASVIAAQQQIDQQVALTQTTRLNLERTSIRSPVDGVVLTRKIEPGQTVQASFAAPELFTIAEDLAKMKIELTVDESDIGQVQAGQSVTFTADAFPEREFKGKVQQVRLAATTTNNVVTYPVIVSVDNSDGTLLPGLTVNAEIEVSKRTGALKAPIAALRYKPRPKEGDAVAAAPMADGMSLSNDMLTEDMTHTAAVMKLKPPQQAAFDAVLAAIEQRKKNAEKIDPAQMRELMQRARSGGPMPGNVMIFTGDSMEDAMARARQMMVDGFKQNFDSFRQTLDDDQKAQWDSALTASANARHATVYRLADGAPQPVTVRVGVSDGNSAEVLSGLKDGDILITGEKAVR